MEATVCFFFFTLRNSAPGLSEGIPSKNKTKPKPNNNKNQTVALPVGFDREAFLRWELVALGSAQI